MKRGISGLFVVLLAPALIAPAGARDMGGHDAGSHPRIERHDKRFEHHHRHFFFHDFVVLSVFGWPYPYYPYWVDYPPGYTNGPIPSAVQLGEPIPGEENCREFQTTLVIDGQGQPAYGKACQQPDGSWRIAP